MPVDFSVTNQLASPAIYASSFATRPSPSFNGRLFVDTDNPSTGIYRDTGTAWIAIAGTSVGEIQSLNDVCVVGNSTTTLGINIFGITAIGQAGGIQITPQASTALTIGDNFESAESLYVAYNAIFNTTAKVNTSLTTPLLIGGTTTTSTLTYRTTSAVGITGARHIFQVGNNGATEAMTILNNANVGIGSATPTEKLTVNGNINITNAAERYIYLDTDNTGTGKLIIQAGGGSTAYGGAINLFSNANATKPGWVSVGLSQNSVSKFTVNNQGLAGGTDIFTVLYNGNILLNTTTDAGFKLDVNGTGRFVNGVTMATTSGNCGIGTASPNGTLGIFKTSMTNQILLGQLTSSGTYGVLSFNGVMSGTSSLGLFGGGGTDTRLYHNVPNGGTHAFTVDGTEKVTISSLGSVGIGNTTPAASSLLDVTSTSKGFLPPRMTTVQKNAITSPAAGLIVYDTTLNKLCVYTTAWETITSI